MNLKLQIFSLKSNDENCSWVSQIFADTILDDMDTAVNKVDMVSALWI